MQERSPPGATGNASAYEAGSVMNADVEESTTVIADESDSAAATERGGMSPVGIVLALFVLTLVVALLFRIFT
jgi:hypothetical protein